MNRLIGGYLPGGGLYTFSFTVSNKRVLATQMGGEEIRLARAFSITRFHLPSCFATRIDLYPSLDQVILSNSWYDDKDENGKIE